MKKIKKAFREVESSLKKLEVFIVLIKALVILSVSYLLFFMLGLSPYFAFVPALIYFISSAFVETKRDLLKIVERHYPSLDEKLRTARDYQDQENMILDILEEDIISNLKKVRVSSFFPYSRAIILILILMVSVSASLYIASQGIQVLDFNMLVEDTLKMFEGEEEEKQEEMDFSGTEESIMQVGDEKIEVEIHPVGIDFDFNDLQEASDYEFSSSFPKDVFISSAASYKSEFSEEQQLLIKRYFENKRR